jgi:AraC-like DNA-binding protein
MYFILKGEGRIEVNGTVYYPRPGQLVVMPCHIRQSYASISDQPYLKYWCHFTARAGSRDLFELFQFPVCIDVANPQEIEDSFRSMIRHMDNPSPASVLLIRASMLQLIAAFTDQGMTYTKTASRSTHKMSQVLHYIEAHLDEKMAVEELAGLVHYHPNYFIRAFREVLGCSPIQYINRLRLDKARQLLASDLPIGSIARRVGIEQHNFSSMFKSYTGFSPRDFRRMLKH